MLFLSPRTIRYLSKTSAEARRGCPQSRKLAAFFDGLGLLPNKPDACQECGAEATWIEKYERWSVVDDVCENCYVEEE